MPGDFNSFAPNQNWQSMGGNGFYGYNNQGGQGIPVARSDLDGLRIGTGRIPSAEYPDGYLGTIRSRRDDKLLDSVKNKVNQKAYQRGVHKGERIEPSMYFWTPDFAADSGIKRQSRAKYDQSSGTYRIPRSAPKSTLAPAPHLVNDGKANMQSDAPAELDARRQNMLSYLKPTWR